MAANPAPYVAEALAHGLGPTAGLRQARADGLRINDGNWFRAYHRGQLDASLHARTIPRPLNRLPKVDGRWKTTASGRKGYAYRVAGLVKDRRTGAEDVIIVTVTSRKLISRGAAIRLALGKFEDPQKKYPRDLIAAFVVQVFEMRP